jgi:hypothetical protein
MAINFPNSPTSGDTHTVGDKTWTWNGTSWDVVVSTPITNLITDADNDTRIHVEESPDEDYIRFDTAGTERMTIGPTGDVAVAGALAVTGALSGTTVTSIQSDISTAQSDITTLETDVTNINELQQNEQTGATYTLVLTDAGKLVETNNASANTLTIPPNSSVAFATGSQIVVIQKGAGQTTLAAGAGVTINSKDSNLNITGQYSAVTLIKAATDTWYAIGDLSA